MSKTVSVPATTRTNSRLQAYVLLLFGIVCLILAWLLHLNPLAYPVGLLLFGVGMLVAAFFNPYRLMIGGILTTLIGASIFFAYKSGFIPDGGNTIVLAIGIGLLGIALAARRGYMGAGALTPSLIVIAVGFVEYSPTNHYLPHTFAPFVLSLWFPGLGLLILGGIYLLLGSREKDVSIR